MTERQNIYAELLQRCRGLVEGESDRIANAANVVAEVHRTMGFLWTGVYRVIGEDLAQLTAIVNGCLSDAVQDSLE